MVVAQIFGLMELLKDLLKEFMSNNFIVEISSDLDYENMIANILFNEEPIAIVSQEKGIDKLEIELFYENSKSIQFSLDKFLKSLQLAKERLIEMQKKTEVKDL